MRGRACIEGVVVALVAAAGGAAGGPPSDACTAEGLLLLPALCTFPCEAGQVAHVRAATASTLDPAGPGVAAVATCGGSVAACVLRAPACGADGVFTSVAGGTGVCAAEGLVGVQVTCWAS